MFIYEYSQVNTVNYITNTIFFIINYVSEHHLPPVTDASRTTPTTRVN